jgi:hypothetical protein
MAELEFTEKLEDNLELTIDSVWVALSDTLSSQRINLTHAQFVAIRDCVDKYYGFADVIKLNIEV